MDLENRVISDVFDTSFGVLRVLIFGQSVAGGGGIMAGVGAGTGTTASVMADMGEVLPSLTPLTVPIDAGGGAGALGSGVCLLHRESGFSIAGLAASLPGAVAQGVWLRTASCMNEAGQWELVEVVSRPASVRLGGEDVHSDEREGAASFSSLPSTQCSSTQPISHARMSSTQIPSPFFSLFLWCYHVTM